MKFPERIREAIDRSLTEGLSFVVFALPGQSEVSFFASIPEEGSRSAAFDDPDSDCFFINIFDNDEPYTAGVRFALSADDVLRSDVPILPRKYSCSIRPRVPSTFRATYREAFSAVKPRLKQDGGKVVLSRLRSIFTAKTPTLIAEEYFSLTDTTFRYLCFTPETGLWLGSTPEVLLESDSAAGIVRTMSLAGTRPVDASGEWDEKNIREQQIVTDYISQILRSKGLNVKIGPLTEKYFLNIKHLCTPIEASGVTDISALMAALSPTPAVAGYPCEKAVDEIGRVETHRRHCYGGYVGVRIGGDYHAFVNLRCVFLAPAACGETEGWLGNLYAGGGIIAASREDDEWLETESKTKVLAEILLGADGHSGCESPRSVSFLTEFHNSTNITPKQ